MNIDLHLHTAVASACSMLSIPQLFKAAKLRGLDGVCITDHSSYAGYHRVKRAASELMPELSVFFGVEVRTTEGDMLVYSEEELSSEVICSVPEPQQLIDYAHKLDGLAVAPHPFRRTAPSLGRVLSELSGLDGIEVQNGNCPDSINAMACEAASTMDVFVTSSSDAHCVSSVGVFYSVFEDPVTTQADLIKALASGMATPAGDGQLLRGL